MVRAVNEPRNHAAQVPEPDVHCDADAALRRPANVVAVPGDGLRDVGVDARCGEEAGEVLRWVVVCAQEDCEADHALVC